MYSDYFDSPTIVKVVNAVPIFELGLHVFV